MDAKQLNETRLRLSGECERLIQSIKRQRLAENELQLEHTEDEGDLATISHERDLLYNLHEGDSVRLRFIRAAIKTIDAGLYGECVDCGSDINGKRLKAVPWATTCLQCQEATEQETSSRMVLAGKETDDLRF